MYGANGNLVDTWCQAKYSMEGFATMIGEEDKFNIYYMSGYDGVCLDTLHWKKTMLLYGGIDAYCAGANEMYKLNRDETRPKAEPNLILCQPALTLDELIEAAK